YTVTALRRWSCADKDLPGVDKIETIHVYDFDNTLFASPLPNKSLWNGQTIGQLGSPDVFLNGGWWHDSAILAATGEGVEKEEPRAWDGWWNEQIVDLVRLSMQQKDALCVLLTGRAERQFAELINRIVKSKGLEFDLITLKPAVGPSNQKFSSTMNFKLEFFTTLVNTYHRATEIRVYEDRPKHTKGFRDFFANLNRQLLNPVPPPPRGTIVAEVIQVPENATVLNAVTEVAEVQKMINNHNTAILAGTAPPTAIPFILRRTVFYTGYLIPAAASQQLQSLVHPPSNVSMSDIRYLANSILITPRPAPPSVLTKVGGIGRRLMWRVTGTACWEGKLWAARVAPIPSTEKVYTENNIPTVVLALRRGARPIDVSRIDNWQPVPVEKEFVFESTVGEKSLLRLEEEKFDYANPDKATSNPHPRPNQIPRGPTHSRGNAQQGKGLRNTGQGKGTKRMREDNDDDRDRDRGGRGGRGGHQRERGGQRGGRGGHRGDRGGRGRGGDRRQGQYRSLDDVGE
ncbi:hypothetical protein P152DRAFT_370096, partial [Eremomyces bilateralis CBS 781.70]